MSVKTTPNRPRRNALTRQNIGSRFRYEFWVPLPGVDDRVAASVVHRGSCPGHITMLVASGVILGNTVLVDVLRFSGPRS